MALVKTMAEFLSRWDFSNWTYLTELACILEETFATHECGFELQRRAWVILNAVQHQRDVDDVNVIQVEARAGRKKASASESGALQSSQTSLFEFASREKSEVLSNQTPSKKQAISEHEKPEDMELILVQEGRRAEQAEDVVEYEQQPQATPQTFTPPLPPSHPAEEMKQQKGVVEYEVLPPSKAPLPPSPQSKGKGKSSGKTKQWNPRHHGRHRCRRLRKFQCRLTGAGAEDT